MSTVTNGHDQCALALIKAGADIEKPDNQGWTPLMSTVANGHDQCARALIEAKANIEAQIPSGHTALMIAAQNGHDQCARALIDAGAALEKVNKDSFTALMLAAKNGHDQCARVLIEGGANLDKQDANKRTAMSLAATNNHRHVVDLLLKHGATMPRLCENNDFDDEKQCVTDGILFECLKDRVVVNKHDEEGLTCYFDPEVYVSRGAPADALAVDPLTRGPFEPMDVSYLVSKLLKNTDGNWKKGDAAMQVTKRPRRKRG